MRNAILSLSIALVLLNGATASAQFVTSVNNKDTAIGYYDGTSTLEVHNNIRSSTANPVYLKWNVTSYNFMTGWDIVNAGFCDNNNCYSAGTPTNNLFTNGTQFKSFAYDNTQFGDFHMLFATSSPAVGTSAWVKVLARDTVSNVSRTLTFIGYRAPLGITTINSSDDVILYPNPARESVNVIFDEKAGVKTIAIYNLIGKLMGPIYKPMNNGSARIDLSEMPNGVYFLRLMDGQGHVLATRRFTRQ
jgi:hypothetical protein